MRSGQRGATVGVLLLWTTALGAACSAAGDGAADAAVSAPDAAPGLDTTHDATPDAATPDAATPDAGGGWDLVLHGITGATPGVATARLDRSHPGWGGADCLGCHLPSHGGPASAACVACHGDNGAPARPAGHATDGCATCHVARHEGLGFADPDDCAACHRFVPPADGGCARVEETDVVVVGAGGGGLAAAATLALEGLGVTLLEQHTKVGGCMTAFERGEYRFEVSLHAMGGLNPGGRTRALFERLGIGDRVVPVAADPLYRAQVGDALLDVPADADAWRERLKERYPAEAEGLDGLFQLFRDVDEAMDALVAWQQGDRTALDALAAEKPAVVARILGYMDATLGEVLADYVSDPELKAFVAQLACYAGAEPSRLSAALFVSMWNSYHSGGFHNFVGGSQSVSDALADVVRENGGRVRLGARVSRIVVTGEGADARATEVRTDDGVCYRPQYVISNASPPATVALVGREALPADWVARVDAAPEAFSIHVVYLGLDGEFTGYFGGTHEWILQDVPDMDAPVTAAGECAPERSILLLANYSVLDPTAAPEGHNVLTLTAGLDYECAEQWHAADRGAYEEFKRDVARVAIERAGRLLPALDRHIEVLEVGAPRTIEAFTLNPRGTIYGSEPTPANSLLQRLPQETPIPNLFLAGAWTFPGPGQAAVLQSGELAARKVLALARPAAPPRAP